MFARFHRSARRGRGEAALGLGLPLTRQFIEAHGGTVELDIRAGQGHQRHPHHPAGAAMIWPDEARHARVRRASWPPQLRPAT